MRKRDKKDIKTLNSHLQEDTFTSHTLPSARLSMNRIVSEIKNRNVTVINVINEQMRG